MSILNSMSPETVRLLEVILDSFDGAIMIDSTGTIVLITEKYAQIAGVSREDSIGKDIKEIFPNSRMLEVIDLGEPIYADLWRLGKETAFVTRAPIRLDGDIVGAVGISAFRYMDEARKFADRMQKMDEELAYYKSQVRMLSGARYSFDAIIGGSSVLASARDSARRMAKNRAPVLLYGETGTGKELFAHAIHQASPRRDRPFVRVNCASIPEHLAESELFGYEDGAFTGAKKGGKAGKFELANGGTIFLDEINELPYFAQAKLLRVLQEGEVDRIGSTATRDVDVRIISATGADLATLVKNRQFREDLWYRINAFTLAIPALRDHPEDIPMLCEHFINTCNYEMGTAVADVDNKVLQLFARYHWPGNVRELRNVMQRACLNAGTDIIHLDHLPHDIVTRFGVTETAEAMNLQSYMDNAERELLIRVLKMMKWNRNRAARALGIHRTSLYAKMKKHQLLDDE